MSGYRQTLHELMSQWSDQLQFVLSSAKLFDMGNESEAKRLATSLRILFHHTRNSNSLLNQLNRERNLYLYSSGSLYTPSNLVSSWVLLQLESSKSGLYYRPLNDKISQRTFFLRYEDWWNEIIFDDKESVFTRKDIVCFVSNQDGGAHVDPILNEKYAKLTKYNSIGWSDSFGRPVNNNPAYNAIRQIANEILISESYFQKGSYTRKREESHYFEMRFMDELRRFKWSTTDIQYSKETFDIVNKYRKEPREAYIHSYPDNSKLEILL
ncbi:hypothetical protein NOM01_14430 [Sporolactobacillus sp. STSJ-5]|uniref:hypothetical protein n=1 Tax=Sporolactobacillus sp. STSJ-5 TaxID=2965076 RepID=UPI002107A995|nr:hypothetical protein [Sporolactobacillus sp. STSJ-5]MCQ2011182.1 hypothetical protein [Sporolactobacillus sp. STSJ-5]